MYSFPTPKTGPMVTYCLILLVALFNIANVGLDSSMINNLPLLNGYYTYFNLDTGLIGLNVAIVTAGCVVSGPFVGPLLDRVGRVRGMMVASLIQCLGALIAGLSPTESGFVIGRFILGLSFTISATACPMYLMEISPPKTRNTMMGVLVGLTALAAAVYGAMLLAVYKYGTTWAWKGYVLGELVSPVMGLILLPFVPESPRWLIFKGRTEEALEILSRLHGKGDCNNDLVQLEYQEICDTIRLEKAAGASWKGLISPASNRRRSLISALTGIINMMNGSGNLLYFMSILLVKLGIESTQTIVLINIGLSVWNMVAMLLGGQFIDRFGRKSTLFYSTIFMSICLIIVGVLQKYIEQTPTTGLTVGAIVVIFLFEFIACASWIVLSYSYPNEIFKFSQRAKGTAISQSIGYAFSFIYLYCFPIALENISWRFFIINGLYNLGFAALIWWLFVETKGKTLEEIDEIFDGTVITGQGTDKIEDESVENSALGERDSDKFESLATAKGS